MADDTKLYTLTVPNYSTNVLMELNSLRTNNLCCDVIICTDEGFFNAHKIVMYSVSSYFKERITLTTEEPDTIDLSETSHQLLNSIINYVYTGILQFNIVQLEPMMQLLNKLEIKDALAKLNNLEKSCNGFDSISGFDLNETPVSEWSKGNVVGGEIGVVEEDNLVMRKRKLYEDDTDIEEYEDIMEQITNTVVENVEESPVDMSEETTVPIVKDTSAIKKPRKSVDKKSKTPIRRPRKKVAPVKISLKKKNVDAAISNNGVKVETDSAPVGNIDGESQRDTPFETVGGYVVKVEPTDSTEDALDSSIDSPIKKKIKSETPSKSKICKVCDEVFPTFKEYSVHRKTHGVVKKKRIHKKNYVCSVCPRAMSSAIRRACHEYSKHGIPYDSKFKLYTCTFEGCDYISANKRYVDNHMRGTHSDNRPHICEYCGKAFKMPGALWTHVNIHTKLKEYKCDECGANFHQQSGLDITSTSTESENSVSEYSNGETSPKNDDLSSKSTQPDNSNEESLAKTDDSSCETKTKPGNSSLKETINIDNQSIQKSTQSDYAIEEISPKIEDIVTQVPIQSDNISEEKTLKIKEIATQIFIQSDKSSEETSVYLGNSTSLKPTNFVTSLPGVSTEPDKLNMETSIKLEKLPPKIFTRRAKSLQNTSTKPDNSTQQTSTDNSTPEMSNEIDDSKQTASSKEDKLVQQTSTKINISKPKSSFKLFECEKCSYKSDKRANLMRHLSSHKRVDSHLNSTKQSTEGPNKQEEFLCDQCAKSFKSKYGLTLHKKQHNGEFKFICSICGKGYNQSTQFRFHFAKHEATTVQCCYCKKAYIGHWSVQRHKKVCSLNPNVPQNIDRSHICEECGQTFSSKDALSYHVKGKHGTASYKWYICGKSFAWRSSLRSHRTRCMKKQFLVSIPDSDS